MLKKTAKLLVFFWVIVGISHAQTHTTPYGRLCNQIFRNLCVSIIAKKNNLYVDYSSFDRIQSLGIELFVGTENYPYTAGLTDHNFFHLLNEDHLAYNLDPNHHFFQTREISNYLIQYLHQEPVRQPIIDKNPFNERYNNNNDCFIHVRLTDTETFNPGTQYYLKALSLILHDQLYIASDDIHNKIIQGIVDQYPNAIVLDFDEIKTIQFGSTCKHVVLSHGSFSAIIGYLSFFSNIYYKQYEPDKMWYGDMFSIPDWKMIE